MVSDIFASFGLQVLFTIGVIVVFGFLIALCNRQFYANFGRSGRVVCYATGFIGTPIHELCHALFCIIFGHKIVEIKLFQISDEDGTLGYVSHSYNRRNVYHQIGNFFIGIAPILGITALLYLFAWLLLPDMTNDFFKVIGGLQLSDGFGPIVKDLFSAVGIFFTYAGQWQWWVFVLIGMFLALHMTLSGADIKGAWGGLIFVLVALLIADAILAFVSMAALNTFTGWMLMAGGYMLSFFALSFVIVLLALALSFILRIVFRLR